MLGRRSSGNASRPEAYGSLAKGAPARADRPNVYLDPYSAKARRELLEAINRGISKSPAIPTIVVADFNLAAGPEDGLFGAALSTFTTAGERKAQSSLLAGARLYDSTCPAEGCTPTVTFERLVKGRFSLSTRHFRRKDRGRMIPGQRANCVQ